MNHKYELPNDHQEVIVTTLNGTKVSGEFVLDSEGGSFWYGDDNGNHVPWEMIAILGWEPA